ncbi:MAG: hypothetical protein WCX79_00435 [Candidatus Paceibacterota bacterium]|jgi:hypothetical protein
MATKDELKNMLVSLVNLKVSEEDITEIDITLKTKMSSITLVERYEGKNKDIPSCYNVEHDNTEPNILEIEACRKCSFVDCKTKCKENPIVKEPVVEPIAPPVVKERRKRTPKVTAPVEVVETPVTPPVVETEKSSVSTFPDALSVAATQPTGTVSSSPVASSKPTGIARIVKLVTFFCKGQNINPSDITINLLKEKAFDIIEGYEDSVVQIAIDEFKKVNGK